MRITTCLQCQGGSFSEYWSPAPSIEAQDLSPECKDLRPVPKYRDPISQPQVTTKIMVPNILIIDKLMN